MEFTGKYWVPVYNILGPSCRITLAHPKYVRAIRGMKTDKKDSIWIADLHKHGLVPGSFIPPADIREIRDLLRCRSKLVSFASSEKNRVQNSLTVSNIMLSNVVSDTFGKSSLAILSHLLKHPDDQDFDFRPLLHGSMLKNQDVIALAIDGAISDVQAGKITLCLSHMDVIKRCIAQIEATAVHLSSSYSGSLYSFSAPTQLSRIKISRTIVAAMKRLSTVALYLQRF
ncbi:MAG TPA: hypothetical protein DCK76_07450 [Desulfotomaculum sp.]|nr:MAG: Transposase IS116/IS110/IS902 family protein [Desulfotomaculum sp. 46_296]HAG11201.1 hypothetical protein [Desulfotomaculum sp.]HBY03163.1 hypothetical protein [Desulfotomaculum sp.]